ncbi:uncharacterized protein LOC141934348 isoform X2 [Strix aluco]|uniref:uncharacterized protein LOC141934348 isoform X2 n=1 Tax=Strix aluco TaxID=111821 RepID=UPI003DA3E358
MLRAGFAPRFPARGAGVCPGAALPPLPGQSQEPLAPLPAPRPVPSAVLGSAWEEEGAPVCWDHPGRCPKAGWALGCPWLCNPGTPCLPAAGRGDADYGDLRDEGHYLYLDEDGSGWGSAGPLEVLAGPARCQDTYPDWISLYCWAPFHATLMATPEGSRCCWDQISRWVHVGPAVPDAHWEQGRRGGRVPVASGRPHAAPSAAPTASSPAAPSCWPSCSPAPGPAPASMPSSCRSTLNTSPTARGLGPPGWAGRPPRWPWLRPWGSVASYPLQPPSRSAEPGEGLKPQQAAAQPLAAPAPARGWQQPPSLPALGIEEWDEGEGDRAEWGGGSGHPWGGSRTRGTGGRLGLGVQVPASALGVGGHREKGPGQRSPDPARAEPLPWHPRGLAGSTRDAGLGEGSPGLGWRPPSGPCPSPPDAPEGAAGLAPGPR